jgi:hypothetical protein
MNIQNARLLIIAVERNCEELNEALASEMAVSADVSWKAANEGS